MSLTQCPGCRQLSFADATVCPSCERAFQPGELQRKAAAEERAFMRKSGALFLATLVIVMGLLFVVFFRS